MILLSELADVSITAFVPHKAFVVLCNTVANTKIFGISDLVSDHDCDKQPSSEYCGEGTKWF